MTEVMQLVCMNVDSLKPPRAERVQPPSRSVEVHGHGMKILIIGSTAISCIVPKPVDHNYGAVGHGNDPKDSYSYHIHSYTLC